jgi:hypothetical protein
MADPPRAACHPAPFAARTAATVLARLASPSNSASARIVDSARICVTQLIRHIFIEAIFGRRPPDFHMRVRRARGLFGVSSTPPGNTAVPNERISIFVERRCKHGAVSGGLRGRRVGTRARRARRSRPGRAISAWLRPLGDVELAPAMRVARTQARAARTGQLRVAGPFTSATWGETTCPPDDRPSARPMHLRTSVVAARSQSSGSCACPVPNRLIRGEGEGETNSSAHLTMTETHDVVSRPLAAAVQATGAWRRGVVGRNRRRRRSSA